MAVRPIARRYPQGRGESNGHLVDMDLAPESVVLSVLRADLRLIARVILRQVVEFQRFSINAFARRLAPAGESGIFRVGMVGW